MQHIVKTQNGYFKIRLRVYPRLIPFLNRLEINKSLKTKCKTQAKLKASIFLHEYQSLKLYSDLRQTTKEQMKELCDEFVVNTLGQTKTYNKRINKTKNTYSQLIKDFCEYYNSKPIGKDTQQAVTSFLQTVFIHLIEPSSRIEDTTLNDLIKVKDIIMELPSRNYKEYKDKSIKQLIKMKIPSEHKLSISRVKAYVKFIKRFFKYCQSHQIITYNPAEFITVTSSVAPADEREPFSLEEMQSFFNKVDSIENENKKAIYYTLAYTGMRISEIWKATIKEKDGVYYFDLTDKKLKLKTKSSYRIIPLHKALIDNGVHLKLPEAIKEFKSSSISHYFSDYIKSEITSNDKKVMYSLRHTFATQLKYAEVNPLVISELLGHSHEGMTMGRYASRYPLETLKLTLDKLYYK